MTRRKTLVVCLEALAVIMLLAAAPSGEPTFLRVLLTGVGTLAACACPIMGTFLVNPLNPVGVWGVTVLCLAAAPLVACPALDTRLPYTTATVLAGLMVGLLVSAILLPIRRHHSLKQYTALIERHETLKGTDECEQSTKPGTGVSSREGAHTPSSTSAPAAPSTSKA